MSHSPSSPLSVLRPSRPEAAAVVWSPLAGEGGEERAKAAARARRHGAIQGLVAAGIGLAIFLFWHRTVALVVWGIAGLVLVLALASPLGAYAVLRRGLERFGFWVGRVLAVLLLTPVFFVFFALFGLFARRGRRDHLERWLEPGAESYWKRREREPRELRHYRRQF